MGLGLGDSVLLLSIKSRVILLFFEDIFGWMVGFSFSSSVSVARGVSISGVYSLDENYGRSFK